MGFTVKITTDSAQGSTTEKVAARNAADAEAIRQAARWSATTGDSVTIKVTEKR